MSNQLDIFDTPPHVHQRTSYEAALQTKPRREGKKARILAFIEKRGRVGATCDEIEIYLGIKHQTASARIRDLYLDKKIEDSGRERKTTSGSPATVWLMAQASSTGSGAAGETSPPAGGSI